MKKFFGLISVIILLVLPGSIITLSILATILILLRKESKNEDE